MQKPKYLSYAWHYNVKQKKEGRPYKSLREKFVNEKVLNFVSENLSFSDEVIAWSKKYIHEMKEKEVNEKIMISQHKERRKVEYQDKKAKLRAMFRDGKFIEEEYEEDIKRLDTEYSDTTSIKVQVDWYSRLMGIVDITERILIVLKSDNIEAKRKILASLGSNLVWDNKNLIIINKKEIDVLINGIKSKKAILSEFEPKKELDNKGLNRKISPFKTDFSKVLRE